MSVLTEQAVPADEDRLLTREEAAKFLGLKVNTLVVWAAQRRQNIPYFKIGRSVRYRRQDLETYLASCRVG